MTKSNLIESYILQYIEDNNLKSGDKLPTEKELCQKFDASKMTVSKVVAKLRVQDVLTSVRGSGLFVASSRVDKEITKLTSFNEDLKSKNAIAETKLIEYVSSSDVDENIKKKMELDENVIVHKIKRLRLMNGDPLAVDIAYLNSNIVSVVDQSKLSGSLYRHLEEDLGIDIVYAKQKISVSYASEDIAKLLNVAKNDAILLIEHLTYTNNNEIFEYVRTHYRADRYSFEVTSYR